MKGVLPSAFGSPKTPWRKPDTKYVTNEIKLDIVEFVDAIIQGGPSQETIVTSELSGLRVFVAIVLALFLLFLFADETKLVSFWEQKRLFLELLPEHFPFCT